MKGHEDNSRASVLGAAVRSGHQHIFRKSRASALERQGLLQSLRPGYSLMAQVL